MIDIHCHLLPGIDDGPKDMAAAIELARQAVADGVSHSVVTPHIHEGRWENTAKDIAHSVDQYRQALTDESIPLFVGMAAEVRIGFEVLAMVEQDSVPFLGRRDGMDVMLLEMPHSHILPGTDKIVIWLLKRNILPMIAHPERNKDVMRDLANLDPLIGLGCLFQVTSGSLVGQFGEVAQKRGMQLLEKGVVTVLASDAHHVKRRPVNLSLGVQAAAEVIGIEAAQQLVSDNPMSIVSSQFV